MNDRKFTLRELGPSDSPALVKLISSFDGDMTTHFLVDAYAALICGTEHQIAGVGVECADVDGLVGLGTVRFSQIRFNGEMLPLAFLDGLKVHEDFRGQGLGYQIADWRIRRAREAWGERCVIATGLLRSNDASRAVARKWCREFIDVAYQPVIVPVSAALPPPMPGVQVRELAPGDHEEFAFKQNQYYESHNLYPPGDANAIIHALEVAAGGRRPYGFFVAADAAGRLLAGAKIWRRGLLKSDTFSNPPPPMRPFTSPPSLPTDPILRDAAVIGLWHETGQIEAARLLWESIRWAVKDQATTVTMALDPRDPLHAVVAARPAFMPHIEITVAMQGPAPIDRQKLLFGYGRL